MSGARATPALGAQALLAAAGAIGQVETRDLLNLPGAHIAPDQALAVAREAAALADAGRGVVVTCGTDTMEEVAMLADLVYGGEAPIAFTGANRPASRPGADGAANLVDAIAVASDAASAGLGVVVVFGGEIHAARLVRKQDATGPAAFGSAQIGPLGRVIDGAVWVGARPRRQPLLDPRDLGARVEVVGAHLGADGRLLDGAAAISDGLVGVLLGAGHAPPAFAEALERAAAALPVVATTRVANGGMLRDTYGFRGSEADVRASRAIAAGLLSPAAARIKLMTCLGARLEREAIARAFAGDDAHPGT